MVTARSQILRAWLTCLFLQMFPTLKCQSPKKLENISAQFALNKCVRKNKNLGNHLLPLYPSQHIVTIRLLVTEKSEYLPPLPPPSSNDPEKTLDAKFLRF